MKQVELGGIWMPELLQVRTRAIFRANLIWRLNAILTLFVPL